MSDMASVLTATQPPCLHMLAGVNTDRWVWGSLKSFWHVGLTGVLGIMVCFSPVLAAVELHSCSNSQDMFWG